MKNYTIYQIFCKSTGRRYIGSTCNLSRRKSGHLKQLKEKNHHSYKLQKAYNLYGKDDFIFTEIRSCNCNLVDILKIEQKHIKKHWSERLYNVKRDISREIIKASGEFVEPIPKHQKTRVFSFKFEQEVCRYMKEFAIKKFQISAQDYDQIKSRQPKITFRKDRDSKYKMKVKR